MQENLPILYDWSCFILGRFRCSKLFNSSSLLHHLGNTTRSKWLIQSQEITFLYLATFYRCFTRRCNFLKTSFFSNLGLPVCVWKKNLLPQQILHNFSLHHLFIFKNINALVHFRGSNIISAYNLASNFAHFVITCNAEPFSSLISTWPSHT